MRNYPLTPPVNINNLPKSFAQNFATIINIPERHIYLLKNVNVLGAGVIFKNLRIFIPSLSWLQDFQSFRQGHILVKQWNKCVSKVESEPVALVYDYWASVNYFHWMVDSLPRLLLIKNVYPNCLLLVPAELPEYIRKTTLLFGFDRLLLLKRFDSYKIKKLVFPELTAPLSFQDPNLINKVRSIILTKLNLVSKKPVKRIYVSRSHQSVRQIINEKILISTLKKHAFEIIFFEELTFEEQIALMLDTAIIVSVHGANLTNIMFMSPGSVVVELMNKNFNNPSYFSLSAVLSLPYYCIPCDLANPLIDSQDYVLNNNAALIIDIKEVENTLITALKDIF
ncbi:glycosyltransferase family 61 protein [Adhaeribacter pallidiroseus]|uniref:glycosyltransferase family 61 protein n=1 Tax=Adhaeribacter pallidiroseus TaxID=2072847 RepID=UPI001F23553C|nr:glycosyltransferase family 61 protein [Adhaeribacter pallidiroseus]